MSGADAGSGESPDIHGYSRRNADSSRRTTSAATICIDRISPKCEGQPGHSRVPSAENGNAMDMIAPDVYFRNYEFPGATTVEKQGVVAIVSDDPATVARLEPVCEFLNLRMEVISSGTDVANVLWEHRPMAVISDIECKDHDGFHVMKEIARYRRDLPVLLLTCGDPVLMGAADAIQDLLGLTSVTPTSEFPMAAQLVVFLAGAGRRAGCLRLVPV
jgi:hypothetical protein